MNYLMTINGKSIGDNLEQFEVTNPGTNEVVGTMPKGAENEADQAIQAAEGAFESWANLTAYDRANYLMKLNDLILDRKSTRLNSSHVAISYAVFCLKKK